MTLVALPVPSPPTPPARSSERTRVLDRGDGTVAKMFLGADASRRRTAEAAVLSAVRHRHIVPVLGLATVEGSPAILLPRLHPRPVSELLAQRGRLSAGEAVTVLVPLLLALLHLARRGLDARIDLAAGVTLDQVLLDGVGAPVVVGLRPAPTSGVARLARPVGGANGAAARLVAEVMTRVPDGSEAVREHLLALTGPAAATPGAAGARAEGARFAPIDELVELLFDLDEPAPLEEPLDGAPPAPPAPARPIQASRSEPVEVATPSAAGPIGVALPELDAAGEVVARVRRLATEGLEVARGVRPRVWGLAAVGAASVIGGAMLLPAATPASRGEGAEGDHAPLTPVPAATASGPAADVPGSAATGSSDADRVLRGDDPVAAGRTLLRLREDCLTALDADCLAGVHQRGSPIEAADRAVVADPGLLAAAILPTVSGIADDVGGFVLLDATAPAGGAAGAAPARDNQDAAGTTPGTTKPASVLVVRTEAGWRLRTIA